jgi:tRNA pseudouridine55 synthase
MKKVFKKILLLNKKEGETPLSTLDGFRKKNKAYKNIKMTYAGRLDPMASGLLLILAGEETKNKEKYLRLDKEYKFEVLFGFATDSYDILGKITYQPHRQDLWGKKELQKKIKENLKFFTGKFMQKYPIYSSKTVKGKQLFEYAREGRKVKMPERGVFVKDLKFLKIRKINNLKLLTNIEKRVKRVKGDFRQEEILKIWRKKLKSNQDKSFLASFKIECGGGTYVRSIANNLGDKIGIPALAFSIKRTKIGNYS